MNKRTHTILNDPELIENRDMWLDRLKNTFDGKYSGPFYLAGRTGHHCGSLAHPDQSDIFHNNPEQALEIGLEDLATQVESARENTSKLFIPFTMEADWYSVHFVDKIFGAEVFYNREQRQWYNHYLKNEIGTLCKPDLSCNETWIMAQNYAKAFMSFDVQLPILGMPVLSSALNISINLYGPEFLIAMLEDPEAAAHDIAVINEVIMELHDWYIQNIPQNRLQPTVSPWRTQPCGFGQLCGCSTHLVSCDLYREMIMPHDDALLAKYPHGGMIHLCGNHKHLIPLFASMPHLRSVQLNDLAADHLEAYVNGLREDQVIYFSPTANMSYEESLRISCGKRMVYIGEYPL